MNAFGLALVWVSLQVSVLCLVAMAVYLIARRGSPKSGAAATLSGLLLAVLLSAVALSPWPRWSYGESTDLAVTETTDKASAGSDITTGSDGKTVESDTADLLATNLDDGISEWYSAESMRQFWIALQEAPATAGAVEEATTLNWSGWLAVIFLVGTGIAVVRLVLGLVTVARHRLRSEAIKEAELLELLDVLCAELGCVRSIVLRQSSDLVSAATIGWRKPLILLPPEWREWTQAERRSVLAHEIAHIRNNDFLFWLFAQAGLLLHFYHPLVHWLANRLRLEQELAADATAAAHSGGARPYLKTLAELALRQADRPVAWPARTFLPTKGTLMRRVEMLRDTGLVRGTAPQWRRGLAVATLLGAAVLLSGFRPPEGGLATAADQFAADETAGEQLAQADKPKRKARKEKKRLQAAAAAAKGGQDKFDLTFVPSTTHMLMGLRPADMSTVKGFQPLVGMIEQNVRPEQTGIPVKEFDQFLVMAVPRTAGGHAFSGQPVLALKTTKSNSFEKFITWSSGGDARDEKEHGGHKYVVGKNGSAYYSPDDRNLIFGPEDVMRYVIDQTKDGATAPSWSKEFQTVAGSQFCFVQDMNAFGAMIARQRSQGGPDPFSSLTMFAPLWEKTKVATAGVQFGADSRATVTGWCSDKDGAVEVQRTVQSLIPLAQNMMAANKQHLQRMPKEVQGQMSAMFKFMDKLLSDIEVEVVSTDSGAKVELNVETDAATIPLMVGLTLPAIQSARAAARRTQSVNNMKQLGLAMHNYHDTYKKLPALVMTAEDGKTKYSWRVALLPFLGEKELFDAYDMRKPWDSEHNLKVLKRMPNVYRHPSENAGVTTSSYYALTGEDTGLGDGEQAVRFRDVVDGLSNTVFVFDAKRAIPWTKPEDIKYSADEDVPALGGYEPGGFNILLGDGSVRFVAKSVDEKTLRAIITRNGREIFTFPSRLPNPGGERPIAP
jgi:beta-lactamase regulating signal transducer with metallopeptidase domain